MGGIFSRPKAPSQPAPRPQPKPKPLPVQAAAPAQKNADAKSLNMGARKRSTKLTGRLGLSDEARTGRKTLLGA
jgi:hypothetical protein